MQTQIHDCASRRRQDEGLLRANLVPAITKGIRMATPPGLNPERLARRRPVAEGLAQPTATTAQSSLWPSMEPLGCL